MRGGDAEVQVRAIVTKETKTSILFSELQQHLPPLPWEEVSPAPQWRRVTCFSPPSFFLSLHRSGCSELHLMGCPHCWGREESAGQQRNDVVAVSREHTDPWKQDAHQASSSWASHPRWLGQQGSLKATHHSVPGLIHASLEPGPHEAQ